MRHSIRTIATIGAVAGALVAGQAGAAVKLSNAFDNSYYSPSESGRGILVDYIPNPDGSGTFFAAAYVFDSDGNPTWLTLQGEFLEHQHVRDEVGIFQTTGGSFGFPFTATTTEQIGTATVRVNSCGSIDFEMTFDNGQFEDVTYEGLQPLGGAGENCVYDEAFSGCPGFASAVPGIERACVLTGTYNNMDMTLTNETTWVLDGLVRWGDDNANSSTLNIEPGTVIAGGGGGTDYIYISPGSQIFANGTEDAPIVLTSENDGFIEGFTPAPGDLGGVVISGNAPVNACPEPPFNCFSEFDASQRFGGDDPHDDSGSISYFQIRYAGIEFAADSEVNAWTFQGVGDGTDAHHLQAYRGQDDGFEWFGGTMNAKHLVVTEGGDDGFDHDLGFSGKVQYGLVYHGSGFGEGYGIEGAGNPDNFTAEPLATPTYANLTLLGNGNGDAGIQFKDGSGGLVWNSVVGGFPLACIEWADAPATYDVAGTPANPSGNTAYMGVVLACDTQFLDDDGNPYPVANFFNSGEFANNVTSGNLRLNGVFPMANSPAIDNGVVPGDDFLDATDYSGAFDPDGRESWLKFAHQPLGGQ